MRLSLFLLTILLFLAAGCRSQDGDLKGPADDSSPAQDERASLPSLLPANSAITNPTQTTIAALTANPSAFEGRMLQVEGLFTSSAGLHCLDRRFGAPASWALTAGPEQIAAGGLENLAAALPDGQITLVVEGAWRSWPIPANCRQEGDPGELYYLEVVRVISPNPIALAPGIPDTGEALTAVEQPPVISTATPTPMLEQPPLPTIDPGDYPPPASAPTIGAGAYPGPAMTPPVNEQSPTTPAPETPFDREPLTPGSLEMGVVGPGISERWPLVITMTQTITLQVIPDAGLELIATVLDSHGQVLSANTTTAPGQKVTLPAVTLPEAGDYTILVTTLESGGGSYAIFLSGEDTYNFLFQENLADASILTGELLPESDHIYFFSGSTGDVVNLTASPLAGADIFLRLFDPSGAILLSFHDEMPAGQEEQIAAFSLPATGLYALVIGETTFSGGEYTVVLDRR